MISKKNIIILSVVLVILIGAFFAVSLLGEDEPNKTPVVGMESIEVFTVASDNVERIDLVVGDEKFGFVCAGADWVFRDDKDVKLKKSAVDHLRMELCAIYASDFIGEDSDVAKYGIDEPEGEYTLTFEDGTTKTFLLGNSDPVSGSYYFKAADNNKIYVLSATKASSLVNDSAYYKDSDILDVDVEKLSSFHMQKGGKTLHLVKSYTQDTDGALVLNWDMKAPFNKKCNVDPVTNNIVAKLSYITVKGFIEKSDSRYAQSGVNTPVAVITISDEDGVSQTIYVGREDGQERYIKTNGRVYLVPKDVVSFIDLDPFVYISKFIFIENIANVSEISVTHGDVTHVATIQGEGDKFVYKLDGKEVLEKTFKSRVYEVVVGLLADEFAVNPARGKAEYTITYRMKNGAVKKMDYCRMDDRNFAVYDERGICEFVIRQKKLDEMFAIIEDVAVGNVK